MSQVRLMTALLFALVFSVILNLALLVTIGGVANASAVIGCVLAIVVVWRELP